MAEQVLTTETGRVLGTRPSRRLRREGKVPAVVYGLGAESVAVAVDHRELRAVLTTDAGLNALINLDVDGERQLSIVKSLQRDPVRQDVIHVDFIRIDPDEEVEVEVPILLTGESRAVIAADGMIDQAMFSLTVLAKPGAIPNELVADISDLDIGDAIRVADLALPQGARTEEDPEDSVAIGTVTRSTIESIEEEAAADLEAEEALEAEEGAAEGDDGDAGDAGGDDSD